MIKILDSSKSLASLVNDKTNGLGQVETISATVTEELNGIYEAEFTLLDTDKHFNDLAVGGIIQIPVNEAGNTQMFRIYYIGKPINEVVEIKAQHITYDLSKTPVKPFSATGAVNAKNGMNNNVMSTTAFTMTTDITNTTSKFTLDIPRSFRECLGGYEGSLLDVFRGEYEWDNLTVKMLAKRGSDNGVRIAYGKNLTDFKQEENIENVYTSVLGYAVVNDTTYTGNIYHKVSATYPKVKIVDFSSDYEGENVPTTAQLTQKAKTYAENNDIEVPNINLTISFVPLYQTEEYKDIAPLERVSLGDTVHIFFDKLNVEASARVIKTTWNVNLGRYDEIELGNAKANLNTILNEVVTETKQSITDTTGFLEGQLNEMASLIINGLGLHKTLVDTGDGAYRIYLHNKKTLAESDTQYIFTSEGFLISTDYGKTWNAGFDSSGNAILNSLATITLKALEINGSTIRGTNIYGTTIVFGDENGTNIIAKTNTGNTGVEFSGNGTISLKSQGALELENYNSSGVAQNGFYLAGANSNYKYAQILNSRNAKMTNNIVLGNYATSNSIEFDNRNLNGDYSANKITEFADSTMNNLYLENYNYNSKNIANRLNIVSNNVNNFYTMIQYDESGNLINEISQGYNKNTQVSYIDLYNWKKVGSDSYTAYNQVNLDANSGIRIQTDGTIRLIAPNGVYVNGTKIG